MLGSVFSVQLPPVSLLAGQARGSKFLEEVCTLVLEALMLTF